ncbi:homoserine kinase [Sphingorhabdus sp. Alg239-R122]|uniref:homoserine kinase n=1 Tax=Sphingorhabdus sp. Alg239-R122 TaxID=2305989 RepID=UPI0013DA587D|nr:homoserine kinase [Sphingorhabdus sp. Alg239-R122]
MAVYTQVSAEDMAAFLSRYSVGQLRSFKGIAEGVENSNYLVETETGRYILTLYEKRVNPDDLPFFISLLDHLAGKGMPVPRAIADNDGMQLQELAGKPACLIEFLQGVSVTQPSSKQAMAAGASLAELHVAAADFKTRRPNSMGIASWNEMAAQCGDSLAHIHGELPDIVNSELAYLEQNWPEGLQHSIIHADLFPDNVLMLGNQVKGVIDFYFSCTDIRAYDLAITHAAWCFSPNGEKFDRALSNALLNGYREHLEQDDAEIYAMHVLARGAALRFTLSRAYDWINTPSDALVTRKNPMDFVRRLQFYRDPKNTVMFA